VKARILDAELSNKYKVGKMKNKVRAQIDFPKYLKRRMSQLEE
jgi:hypothetical protein